MPKLSFDKEQLSELFPGTEITYRDISKASTLFPIRTSLNKKYGFDEWGAKEVADYLTESRLKKLGKIDKPKRGHAEIEAERVAVPAENRTYEQRLSALVSHFDPKTITANDAQSFRQMAQLEVQMQVITDDLSHQGDGFDVQRMKLLNETLVKLSSEYRQLQSSLGIDRSSRETQVNTGEELRRMIEGANGLLISHVLPIRCDKCIGEGIVINQGYILFHFRQNVEWSWISICPKCGSSITIRSEDGKVGNAVITGTATEHNGHTETPANAEPNGLQQSDARKIGL